jgi:hypothetical protein
VEQAPPAVPARQSPAAAGQAAVQREQVARQKQAVQPDQAEQPDPVGDLNPAAVQKVVAEEEQKAAVAEEQKAAEPNESSRGRSNEIRRGGPSLGFGSPLYVSPCRNANPHSVRVRALRISVLKCV